MDRSEVLKAVEIAAEEASAAAVGLKCTGQGRAFTWYSKQADLLRAAAELIRAGGWRPISEFADDDEYMTFGAWVNGQWNATRVMLSKPRAIALGYTHYLPEPEPPAREVPNDRG